MNTLYAAAGMKRSDYPAKDHQTAMVFVKANIARELYGTEAYYRIITTTDNMVTKALGYFR
jgi:hypothetical protein